MTTTCSMRIIHFGDCYILSNLPRLKTLVDRWKRMPLNISFGDSERVLPDKVLVTCGGDFLAPSLLSTIDNGATMIDCLNTLPVSHVCFGNHESDVPYSELLKRIQQFRGVWLNTNFAEVTSETLPSQDIVTLSSKDGRVVKRIGLLGLLCNSPHLYRDGAFDGMVSLIRNPIQSGIQKCRELKENGADAIIALTHIDQYEDEIFARAAKAHGLSMILGAHDHGVTNVIENGIPIAKAGTDATHAAIADIVFPPEANQSQLLYEPAVTNLPIVDVRLESVLGFPRDRAMMPIVQRGENLVKALDDMCLAKPQHFLDHMPALLKSIAGVDAEHLSIEDVSFSSKGVRVAECSLPRLICTILRYELRADCAIIDGGSVRGNTDYSGRFTVADLRSELPFENLTSVVEIPGKILAEAVEQSRTCAAVDGGPGRGNPFFLHMDDGCYCNKNHVLEMVCGKPVKPDKLYRVAIGVDLGFGASQPPLLKYAKEYPERIPPKSDAVAAKDVVLEHFVRFIWDDLPPFSELDVNGDGLVSREVVMSAYTDAFSGGTEATASQRIAAEAMVAEACGSMISVGEEMREDEYKAVLVKKTRQFRRWLSDLDVAIAERPILALSKSVRCTPGKGHHTSS